MPDGQSDYLVFFIAVFFFYIKGVVDADHRRFRFEFKKFKSEENKMEERKYTFYDKFQKIRYTNVTKEELEVLNHYYAKDYYMMKLQYAQMKISTFTDLGNDNTEITDFLADTHILVERETTNRMVLQGMMTDLTEKERIVIEDIVLGGFTSAEVAEKLNVSSRQISRYKRSALEKLLVKMKEAGYDNFDEAAADFLI